jgi:hypothetical protein
MKNQELNAAELEQVVGATTQQSGDDRGINIADCPNVRVDVTPI